MITDLERMVARLVDQIRTQDPGAVHRAMTVADLRGQILPYRAHRTALGLTSNDDYETLVLRLVAEEGGLTRTFPPEAAARAREELSSPNPNLDLVEELAEATVQVGAATLARLDELAREPAPVAAVHPDPAGLHPDLTASTVPASAPADEESLVAASAAEPRPHSPPTPAPPPTPPDVPVFEAVDIPGAEAAGARIEAPFESAATETSASGSAGAAAHCPQCDAALPTHRRVAYCPQCGHQVGVRRCRRCGEELEAGWRHCVGCGGPVPGPVA
ncbi:MAG: zinc ribbon domain-containing protein [Gemmatimonadetes bacterium]|nr:zinc ribbon domain-containing protein [Gemmatimonadota bacterium]